MEKLSVTKLANLVQTEGDAYAFMEKLRWGEGGEALCPHCANLGAYFIKPRNGETRMTNRGSGTQRRLWKCKACRKQFTVLVGTIFHGSHIPVRTWLFVLFEMCSNKNGIAAREIERKYGLTPKSAWFMTQRIREGMKRDPLASMLAGTVVADETYIGGKPKNVHRQGVSRRPGGGQAKPHIPPKTAVVTLVHKETGEARSHVVANVDGSTLRKVLSDQVRLADSDLHTDALMAYRQTGQTARSHQWVDHSSNEYVRGSVSTNQAENFFSQLKRSIDGTHHHVSAEHLPRYLAEFDFRYSTRKLSDTARMSKLMGQVAGRRLSYRDPLGR